MRRPRLSEGRRVRSGRGIRTLLVALGAACGPGTATPEAAPPTLPDSLNLAADPVAVLASARQLMEADSNAALVTVDADGRPRVRTVLTMLGDVDAADPGRGVTVWIMTRRGSRKVSQIADNAKVTLYYDDDAAVRYATLMGTAFVHTDPEHPDARRFYRSRLIDEESIRYFWPAFPDDFAMIEVRADWLEYMGQADHHPDAATWRPQAVVFRR